ncbi:MULTISPECIES: DUF928 domain-containing protein [Calothrix]|uniref:DUF928 domain-containing protein n=2 Tax=Calothrix TaxID=1186 RepID=A0ABR8AIW6_9CYAN|nr:MULTISPECIES: DUF928 domain-containing protein [Calothrix]MBD2199967.1 DUF928 domain-containing protein [Calothrix parietina FACHB-288]MBD2228866.1 DUF928 domain-containing protein [Calothrix anomala FACHB-343]
MTQMQKYRRKVLLTNAIALILTSFLGSYLQVLAQEKAKKEPNFSGDGRPRKTASTGSRGDICYFTNKPLKLLVHQNPNNGATTASERPTFWIYVPYKKVPENAFKFNLKDPSGKDYPLKVAGGINSPGIISITLPKEIPALEINKDYQWTFSVDCSIVTGVSSKVPDEIIGWVKRVPLDSSIVTKIEQASPSDRSKIYADQGIWYDTLNTLAEALRNDPKNPQLLASWKELLGYSTVNLKDFDSEPITPCCTAQQ